MDKKEATYQSLPFRGERGIRTPGTLLYNGFQDRRIRPLCHFSAAKIQLFYFDNNIDKKNILNILHVVIKQLYIIKIKLLNNNYFVQEVKKQN